MEPYGISRLEAEQDLRVIAAETGIGVLILRPVLVYGLWAKASFLNMIYWLYKGGPLPFWAIHRKRSMVALNNLVDLIVTCIDHPTAANQTFLVSDGANLSTTELLSKVAVVLGTPARLLPVPSLVLELGARLLGRPALAKWLCGSLQVNISKTRELLGWPLPSVSKKPCGALLFTSLHSTEFAQLWSSVEFEGRREWATRSFPAALNSPVLHSTPETAVH